MKFQREMLQIAEDTFKTCPFLPNRKQGQHYTTYWHYIMYCSVSKAHCHALLLLLLSSTEPHQSMHHLTPEAAVTLCKRGKNERYTT